jgi:transposase InsO family protein
MRGGLDVPREIYAPVVAKMRSLAAQYPRYGYRMIRVFLGRAGHPMSVERAHRLWKQNRLQVPKKSRKRRKAEAQPRPERSRCPGGVWACDFVFDACANGQKLKCFTVIDECTRESLAIEVAGSGLRGTLATFRRRDASALPVRRTAAAYEIICVNRSKLARRTA